ncbi:CPBP family intramembrane glutamic endopeptidase [Alkaliphilus transvaalensis]|uniref:CPBP family intramembrane glutamic endopeptidase n=1 Tax=Alkaliphilus transvaalensis TaxID=114628 RepID=UPI000479B59D|nr:CPBP family intramembrane glutamic endopeptidase [Alkaliphilus transvaalensis]
MKDETIKKNIALFFIFVFGLPLICLFIVKNFSIFQSGMPNFIMYGIQTMTPTLAALIVVATLGGSREMQLFIKKCYFDNIRIGYIAIAVLLPLTILTISKLTSLIFVDGNLFITGITKKKLIIIMWALIAEEIGWRGFLQEKLDKLYGFFTTPLLVGIIWALWHYHLFWLGTMTAPIVLFVSGCIADSFIYYWVTKKSKGNVIPASVLHFTQNLFISLFLINPEYNHGSTIPYLIFVAYSIIMAIGVTMWELKTKKKHGAISW